MSEKKETKDSQDSAATKGETPQSEAKKIDLGLLEEDDEFEEFPVDEWQDAKAPEEGEDDVNVWEDNWDDDTVEDDFSKQLRAELEKHAAAVKR